MIFQKPCEKTVPHVQLYFLYYKIELFVVVKCTEDEYTNVVYIFYFTRNISKEKYCNFIERISRLLMKCAQKKLEMTSLANIKTIERP